MSNPLVTEHSSSKSETEAVPSPPFHPGGGGGNVACVPWYVLCVLHHRFTALNTKARHLCKSFLMRELSVTWYRSREMDLSLLVCVVLVLIISSVCGSSGNSSRFLNKVLVAFLILMFGFTGLSAFLPSLRSWHVRRLQSIHPRRNNANRYCLEFLSTF